MRRVIVSKKSVQFSVSCLCIVSSAAFYAASFLSDFCWFFSFFCFVPLFCQQFSSYARAAVSGCLWGIVAYGLTISALLEVMIRLGEKPISYWYAGGFLAYFIFFSTLWFVLARAFAYVTKSWLIGWLLSSFLYYVWIQTGFFYFLVRHWYGYGLACPLLPLMNAPTFLRLLPMIGWYGLLAALLCLQVGSATKKRSLFFLGAVPFLLGFFLSDQNYDHKKRHDIALVTHSFCEKDLYQRAQEVADVLAEAERNYPEARLFILPESTFPFPLNQYVDVQKKWFEQGALKDAFIVIGSHYAGSDEQGESCLYNSVYVLHKERIIYRYDKKNLLPFFEEQPFGTILLQEDASPFLKDKCVFSSQQCKQDGCAIPGMGNFSFLVCSELLWTMPKDKQVIVVVHDGHYVFSYFSRLFKRYAQFQALEKRTYLLYCGWRQLDD